MKNKLHRSIFFLILLSAVIYAVQIAVFHDIRTTEFYLLQDLAFLPLTIAIATIVVGEIMDRHEKEEQQKKTRMLTSTFYSDCGTLLMLKLYQMSNKDESIQQILLVQNNTVGEQNRLLEESDIQIHLTEAGYQEINELILTRRTELLVLSSNPMLFEHEGFTKLLWGIFHLMDEFRLRGNYADLTEADKEHFEGDFEKVMRLLVKNWIVNAEYMKNSYPDFYSTARNKLEYMHMEQTKRHQ